MKLDWETVPGLPGVTPEGFGLRILQADDGCALGALRWNAYRGTIDDEGATLTEAITEAEATLAGAWGPLITTASLAAVVEGRLIAAVVVVRDDKHDRVPLLAFALTEPTWQRRGIGAWLIHESITRLASLGVSEVHLAVTRGNPAQDLYERFGFRVVA